MGEVQSTALCRCPVDDAERAWREVARWPAWVEGLAEVRGVWGTWPQPGSGVRWVSTPAGRGSVEERVVRYEPLVRVELDVRDDQMTARQTIAFHPAAAGETEVTLALRYTLNGTRILRPLLDRLFVRRAMAISVQSTLRRFVAEAEAGGPSGAGR
jgi:uncharacterized membrane protein